MSCVYSNPDKLEKLHYTTLHHTKPSIKTRTSEHTPRETLLYTALLYTTLHYTALLYSTLHYTKPTSILKDALREKPFQPQRTHPLPLLVAFPLPCPRPLVPPPSFPLPAPCPLPFCARSWEQERPFLPKCWPAPCSRSCLASAWEEACLSGIMPERMV